MTDATLTLHRIIADCVQNELRWREAGAPIDLFQLGEGIATDVLRRLRDAGEVAVAGLA